MNYNGFFTVKGNVIYCNIPLVRLAKLAFENKKASLALEKLESLIKKGYQFSSYFDYKVNNSCYFEKSHINAPKKRKRKLTKEQENERKRRTKCLTIRRANSVLA